MNRRLLLVGVFSCVIGIVTAAPRKLVIVSWDGAPARILNRLLAQNKLPNVARLAGRGFRAEGTIPPFPSKTAVSHFAIFSGTWPSLSGVSGNQSPVLPGRDHTRLETRSGFDAATHQTEPLWISAAKAGKKVLVLSAAGSYPPGPDQARLAGNPQALARYIEFSGFESGFAESQVIELTQPMMRKIVRVGDTELSLALIPSSGNQPSNVTIRLLDKSWNVTPHRSGDHLVGWSGPIPVQKGDLKGTTYARVFRWSKSSASVYLRSSAGMRGTESTAENERYMKAYGGFHDAPTELYQAGAFGAPLTRGGDGAAERFLVECIAEDLALAKRSFRYGWKRWQPDLTFHYTPQTDNVGHLWMGVLDPEGPNYDPSMAAKIWPYYVRVWQLQDDWLGDMIHMAGHNTVFALVSDHGMAGVGKTFYVNRILEQAGLCRFDTSGRLDLAHSKVFSAPWGDFCVVANTTDFKGGILTAAEAPSFLEQARLALLAARDLDGRPIVRRVLGRNEVAVVGGGGPAGGDLYLDLVPGFYPSGAAGADVISWNHDTLGNGAHGFYPVRQDMRAIFVAGGPGVPHAKVGVIPVIDIVPTLCAIMGWRSPADSQGKAAVLAR